MKRIPTALFLVFFVGSICAQTPYARRGVLDLRQWDFSQKGPTTLSGEWELYMMELVPPEKIHADSSLVTDYVDFPALWNTAANSGKGYATYALTVFVKPQTYQFELPHFYSAYKLWINNKPIAQNGTVGTSKESSVPQWLPKTVEYKAETERLDLVIQASNFHHSKGGVRSPLRIGVNGDLATKHAWSVNSTFGLSLTLIILATVYFLIFIFFKQDRGTIYFAALALTWALREGFSNLYVITGLFPSFPWEIGVKIEYITLYMTMVWAIMLMASIFKQDVSSLFKYFFVACNLIFAGLTVFLPASFYTQFLPIYLSFAAFLILYILYVVIYAVIHEREGVWFMVSCIMMGAIVFAFDIIAYEGFVTFNAAIINIGYIIMFILLAASLAWKLGVIRKKTGKSNMLTYDDLYRTK